MDVICIGSGNVATHMAQALKASGANLLQVWSRNPTHAESLARLVGAQPVTDFNAINRNADLYVIAVKDDAIGMVAAELKGINGLIVHTSGATALSILASLQNHGVLYPLQTFSKDREIDFRKIPLCIEAPDDVMLTRIESIASLLSDSVYHINSNQRKSLHLAAVFACNFVNQLYVLGNQILEHNHLDFELLRPLIMETAMKIQHELPVNVQTGPAVRGDRQTMDNHLQLLGARPDLAEIYETLSKSIKKTHS